MHATSKQSAGVLVAAMLLAASLAGCGGSNQVAFAECGNGVLNDGEQCDEGTMNNDNGDCLTTCVLAVCGDTFVDSLGPSYFEECDTKNFNGMDCTSLGFDPGTLACTANCTFDTSGCPSRRTPTPTNTTTATITGTATPSLTPTPRESLTPTPTLSGPTPTTTPTPSPTAVPTCETVDVLVSLVYDPNQVPDLAGLVVDLNYQPSLVSIPGSDSDESVIVRVTDVSGAAGIAVIEDRDTNQDGMDDQLHTNYVTTGNILPAPFEVVRFDCNTGQPAPTTADFECVASDATDHQGFPVEGVTCSVTIQ